MTAMAWTRRDAVVTSPELRAAIQRRLHVLEDQLGAINAKREAMSGDMARQLVEARLQVLREMIEVLSREGVEP